MMGRSSMPKQMMREGGKVKPKKKKLTAAQITAIRNKPVSQRTMAEVRMIIPNAVNKMGHTQAEFDKYSSGAKQVNEARAANKAAAAKPVQGAGNMPLDDKQAAQQVDFLKSKNKEKEVKEVKGAKKMNMGGMTAPMMGASGAPQSGPKKPMMPPKRKPAPRPIVDPRAKAPDPRMKDPRERGGAMPMMKKGGKVRGYGMARGGKACKMR